MLILFITVNAIALYYNERLIYSPSIAFVRAIIIMMHNTEREQFKNSLIILLSVWKNGLQQSNFIVPIDKSIKTLFINITTSVKHNLI